MQPLQICIGPIIRIGRESWCLPYAGFFILLIIVEHNKANGWFHVKTRRKKVANIGHNISKSVIAESTSSNETRSQRTDNLPDTDEIMNLSNWQPSNESSILEEMTQPTHPYRSRKVGVTAHDQEKRERRPNWMSKKCTSCGKGFNSLSRPLQCKGCDTWSHKKSKCLSEGAQRNSEYNCKTCKPASAPTSVFKHSQN